MAADAIYVRIAIRAPLDRVWELTQTPELHSRWDLRFSSIRPTDALPSGGGIASSTNAVRNRIFGFLFGDEGEFTCEFPVASDAPARLKPVRTEARE